MAQDIVSGLFGPSPADVQQMRMREMQETAAATANQDLRGQANYFLGLAGQSLGRGLGGMMGLVDPMEEQAKMRQDVMSTGTTDLSSAAGLRAKGKEFAARGDNQTAMRLFLAASQQEKEDQKMLIDQRKQILSERKQEFQEQDALDFKRQQLQQRAEEARQRAEDRKASAAERVAAMREANAIRLEIAKLSANTRLAAQESKVKPDLPTPALKLQQEELDAIGTTDMINRDLKKYQGMIDKKELDLGFLNNLLARGKNLMGASDPQSVAFANFKADMEKLRNDSLRLNKGTQTEGDAVRAWNELFENITDPNVVKSRLKTIEQKNEQAREYRKKNVNTIRQNFKAEPFDFTEYSAPTTTPATSAASGGWVIRPKTP